MTFPVWLSLALTVINAIIAYLQIQTTVVLDPIQTLIVNLVAVVVTTVLAFQRQATNTVRRMQGKPPVPPVRG